MLGQGNFGKVCLASVSNEQIREESDIGKELNILDTSSGSLPATPNRKFSMRRQQNTYALKNSTSDKDVEMSDVPLLPKNSRLAAVKMVKG